MRSGTAAIILAGGRSRRMGRPKAWLQLGTQHLLQRVTEVALNSCGQVVVVGSPHQSLPPLPNAVRQVFDPPQCANEGPLRGVTTGLRAVDGAPVAYLGSVDALFVCREHIEHILVQLEAQPSVDAAVPVSTDGDHPITHGLSAAVRVAPALAVAEQLLRGGTRSLRTLYTELRTLRLDTETLPDPWAVRGCNTPEQWATALADLRVRNL